MKLLWVCLYVALGLGGALVLAQDVDDVRLNELFERYRAEFGATQVIEANEGLLVVERRQEGSTDPGTLSSGLYVTKFIDGDTTCYVLQHSGEENSISCVR